jgi:hypothetical protein
LDKDREKSKTFEVTKSTVDEYVNLLLDVDRNDKEMNVLEGQAGYLYILLKLEHMIRTKFQECEDSEEEED